MVPIIIMVMEQLTPQINKLLQLHHLHPLHHPSDVAVDIYDHVIVADTDNHCIRVLGRVAVAPEEYPDRYGHEIPNAERWMYVPSSKSPSPFCRPSNSMRQQRSTARSGPESRAACTHTGTTSAACAGRRWRPGA